MDTDLINKFLFWQCQIGAWQDKTFPKATKDTVLAHLKSEIDELIESHDPSEAADCFLLLVAHANKCGYNLFEEAEKKLEINKTRKWGEQNAKGYWTHIEEFND